MEVCNGDKLIFSECNILVETFSDSRIEFNTLLKRPLIQGVQHFGYHE